MRAAEAFPVKRSERRAARIREEIPIEAVLHSYGYAVTHGADRRDQQFSCDLHGDGKDSKPSARCYPDSNQWYCWACYTSRDAVATVREKEGLGFGAALDLLEKRYRLPPLPWEDEDEDRGGREAPPGPEGIVSKALRAPEAEPAAELSRVARLIANARLEGGIPAPILASWWERHDYLRSFIGEGVEAPLEWSQWVWELRVELVAAASRGPGGP